MDRERESGSERVREIKGCYVDRAENELSG